MGNLKSRVISKARRTVMPGHAMRAFPFGLFRGLHAERSLQSPFWVWSGFHEYEIQRHLRRLNPPGGLAYDVGGADGVFALAFARLTGRCATFEGADDRLPTLKRNVRANPGLRQWVQVIPEYVGTKHLRLDDYMRQPPTFMKIDVEGAESDVLESARGILTEHRPHLVIEVHGSDQERACGDMLTGLGYAPIVVPQRRRLREHGRERAGFDLNRWLICEGAPATRTA